MRRSRRHDSARATHVRNHARPEVRRVVRAVDARNVHAAPRQVEDQIWVRGRLRPERHHDHAAARLAPAEQLGAVALEQALAAIEGPRARERR